MMVPMTEWLATQEALRKGLERQEMTAEEHAKHEQQLRHEQFAAVSAQAMKEYREANPELFEQEQKVTSLWQFFGAALGETKPTDWDEYAELVLSQQSGTLTIKSHPFVVKDPRTLEHIAKRGVKKVRGAKDYE